MELEIESNAKVKALKLRVTGQLRTIKSLEAQLSQTLSVLEGHPLTELLIAAALLLMLKILQRKHIVNFQTEIDNWHKPSRR